jgi:hypothetical protein
VIKKNKDPNQHYDGYAGCPILVGGKKVMLAEFKYDHELAQTFFNDQEKPRRIFYHLKKDFFPAVYWWYRRAFGLEKRALNFGEILIN